VLVLTPSRLVAAHVDDQDGGPDHPASAAATTEAVPLRAIRSVGLTHVIAEPVEYRRGDGARTTELNLAINWGGTSRVDVEPASCGDPDCEADHGVAGALMPEDLVVRVASAADGAAALHRAVAFARALSAATTGR
jgi:hypothetical protein